MPAYMIALNRTLRDRRKLEEYGQAAGPTFESLGAKRLAICTPLILLEMMGPLDSAVVFEFPDVETASTDTRVQPIKTPRSTGTVRLMSK